MESHVLYEDSGKILKFRTWKKIVCHYSLPSVLYHVEMSWFVSIVRNNVHQTFSKFYHILHIRYHDISTSFMIFGLRLHFIEFKNNSSASSWSCFVKKMFKISGLFLDTASHYTQYHEYHFFNH